MFKLNYCSFTLKKHLSGVLDFTKMKFIHPSMLGETYKYCLIQQVGSKSLQKVHSHTRRLGTGAYP